jgi:hypothetical protein
VGIFGISALNRAPETTGSGSSQGSGGGSAAAAPARSAGPGLNQAVRDGQFEFTVTNVDCGRSTLGGQTAQGQYCVVSMTVKNIGKEPRSFDADNQFAYSADGAKLSADGLATLSLDDANSFLNEINPGNSVKGVVAFDIPKGSKIEHLELHDDFLSQGVAVTVS